MGGGHIPTEGLNADELDMLIESAVSGEVKRSNSARAMAREALFLDDGGDIFGEIWTRGRALGWGECGDSQYSGRSRGGNNGFGEHRDSLPFETFAVHLSRDRLATGCDSCGRI